MGLGLGLGVDDDANVPGWRMKDGHAEGGGQFGDAEERESGNDGERGAVVVERHYGYGFESQPRTIPHSALPLGKVAAAPLAPPNPPPLSLDTPTSQTRRDSRGAAAVVRILRANEPHIHE